MAAQLNPDIVSWAASRCGLSDEDIVHKFPKYNQWIDGTWKPTVRQLNELAKMLHVRLFELFSDTRPDYELQIADFRTVDDLHSTEPSPELYDTIDMMLARQLWMKDYFLAEGYGTVGFVGSYKGLSADKDKVRKLVAELHNLLKLDFAWASQCKTADDALKVLKNCIEALGVSVVVNGVVGDNTHRPLQVDEFRGFVLADNVAPVIFINGKDTKTAQIFTLIHELGHLAFAETGVSNVADYQDADSATEQFCNQVAAEFLVPAATITSAWKDRRNSSYEKTKKIAMACKVNFVVVARKARDEGLISNEEYFALYGQYKEKVPAPAKKSSTGGDFFRTKQYKLGSVFSDAIRAAVNTNYINYRDAYELTGLSAPNFKKYFEEVV